MIALSTNLRISVITPSFNGAATIRDTIASVLRQDFPDVEHIVVDGGSTDGTVQIIKEYPHLHWTSAKDEGHYDAMNKGIARATGDLIVILNADDCFRPGAFKSVVSAYQIHPEWDASFGDVVYVDGQGKEIYRREEARYDYDVLRYWEDYICHHTLFVRRTVYDRLGGYRHKDFKNACDYEFILRLGREKCVVGHVPALLVDYRFHEMGQSADMRVMRNMQKESLQIRGEHGVPAGVWGRAFSYCFRGKRQFQKLFYRGKCDLIPGRWLLRRHMHERARFSSNSGVDKL
jgi:glycosyltransferase involved in cell wall biosynthesis